MANKKAKTPETKASGVSALSNPNQEQHYQLPLIIALFRQYRVLGVLYLEWLKM
jgi:hypothetical protein